MERCCQSCGGVLGRDCYNEYECMDISRRMEAERHEQSTMNRDDEFAAARLAGKIEGMEWAAVFCENVQEPQIAEAIRVGIAELKKET